MRAQRRALSAEQRIAAATRLEYFLYKLPKFSQSRRIAFYLACQGEMDLGPIVRRAWLSSKSCFLPVIQTNNQLAFFRYQDSSVLKKNRFNIDEPNPYFEQRSAVTSLDLVLMPLVAFDRNGHRLGMGGGYYDRTFAFLRHRKHWRRPVLVGVAYAFQEVDVLQPQVWDVPMDFVVTDAGVYR